MAPPPSASCSRTPPSHISPCCCSPLKSRASISAASPVSASTASSSNPSTRSHWRNKSPISSAGKRDRPTLRRRCRQPDCLGAALPMDKKAEAKVDDLIASLWKKNLPSLRERLNLLDRAADEASSGALAEATRAEAQSIAH